MWTIIIVVAAIFLLAGLGRTLFKGEYRSLRDFLLTMFFLDLVFDDWGGDSDISDIDI
jgi:uncharacterized membrane protein YozB (DUF420 family)